MKSQIIPVRLRPHEVSMLNKICKSGVRGDLTRSEMIRLLIHREYTRRTQNTSVVAAGAYESESRRREYKYR